MHFRLTGKQHPLPQLHPYLQLESPTCLLHMLLCKIWNSWEQIPILPSQLECGWKDSISGEWKGRLFRILKKFWKTGAAEQVQQTQRPPDQCFDWGRIADPFLAGKKPAYHLYRSMLAQTSQSGSKRDLRRPDNEQILSVVDTHSRSVLLGIQ